MKAIIREAMKLRTLLLITGVVAVSGVIFPGITFGAPSVVDKLLSEYAQAARMADPGFKTFNARAGRELYDLKRRHTKKNQMISCSSCHTPDPKRIGQTSAGKPIEPLSPAANPKRLTDEREIRKWFMRNCNQVLERDCTPLEKGNFLQFLLNT